MNLDRKIVSRKIPVELHISSSKDSPCIQRSTHCEQPGTEELPSFCLLLSFPWSRLFLCFVRSYVLSFLMSRPFLCFLLSYVLYCPMFFPFLSFPFSMFGTVLCFALSHVLSFPLPRPFIIRFVFYFVAHFLIFWPCLKSQVFCPFCLVSLMFCM